MATTMAEKREHSGTETCKGGRGTVVVETPQQPPTSSTPKTSSIAQKDAIALLRQLRDDVVFLDSRLNNMEDKNLQEKLKAMKNEKDETEQVLSTLRGKLEEHKRLSQSKRQALKERRNGAAAATAGSNVNGDGNNSGKSSPTSSPEAVSPISSLDANHQPNQMLETLKEEENEEIKSSEQDLSEKEAEELEEKISALEAQKDDMERTLLELLRTYEDKTSVLQLEKQRLEDDKTSTYTEMKSLLIEQHHESERLRHKVKKLETKRKKVTFAVKAFFGGLLMILIGAGLWVTFVVDDPSVIFGSLNYICAPARPGGPPITEATGTVEAPWWAPSFTKRFLFPLVCEDRPRIRMEFKRDTLMITEQPGNAVLGKKFGHMARIESDSIRISDRGGGYKEFEAPWSIPEVKQS